MEGARYVGAVGGTESLVARCSHWHLKLGAGFAVMQGNKGGGRETENANPQGSGMSSVLLHL